MHPKDCAVCARLNLTSRRPKRRTGRHVDTTRVVDAHPNPDNMLARWERELLTGIPTPSRAHRKPGLAN